MRRSQRGQPGYRFVDHLARWLEPVPGLLTLSTALLAGAAGCTGSNAPASTEPSSAEAPSIEVMHWLTSTRDDSALAVLRNALVTRGGIWRDTPMPDAGSTGRATAVSRIVGGQSPDVFQFSLGSQLDELAAQHLAAAVPGDSSAWHTFFPAAIDRAASFQGQHIAVPIDIRGENWLFYNTAVLRDAGVAVPRSWPEFLAAAATLKAKGKIPLALGGQPWQERILFNAVLLGIGGRDLYRRLYERSDHTALQTDALLRVFETFGSLRDYVDQGSPGRRWNHTTKLVTSGQAAFQIMGDWAKDEIIAAGMHPGVEIGCVLAPATEEAYIMLVDVFAFAPTTNTATKSGQLLFARVVQDPLVQVEFTRRLGAIPARTDAPKEGFDSCSARAMEVVRNADSQLMDPSLLLPGGLAGAIDDTLARFWHDRNLTPSRGRELLRETFLTYQ